MSDIIMLHGFTGGPDSFADVERMLGKAHRCITLASVGHCGADDCDDIACWDDEVARLIAESQKRGFQKGTLLGYSLGARLGLGMLLAAPHKFDSACLIGVNPGLATENERAQRRRSDEKWCRLLETQGLSAFIAAWQALPLFFVSQSNLPKSRLQAQSRIRESQTSQGLCRSLRITGLGHMPHYVDRLSELQIPISLVVGDLDRKFKEIALAMLPHLPHGHLEIISDSGHNLVLEHPDAVVYILRRLIEART